MNLKVTYTDSTEDTFGDVLEPEVEDGALLISHANRNQKRAIPIDSVRKYELIEGKESVREEVLIPEKKAKKEKKKPS